MGSFEDTLIQEPERFIEGIRKKNRNVKTFEEFSIAFRQYMGDSESGKLSKSTSDDIITLFQTSEAKELIRNNTTKEEFEEAYGDGIRVTYEPVGKKKVVRVEAPKVSKSGYTNRKGHIVKPYSAGKPRRFTPVETRFIQTRKQKGLSYKQIINDYNNSFDNPRSESSLKNKIYKTK